MIGSAHINNNEIFCIYINHPIKTNHVSTISFGKENLLRKFEILSITQLKEIINS